MDAIAGREGIAMRGRKLRWMLAGLSLALLAVGAVAMWPQPDRITRENCDRITKGMTKMEVQAILGQPGDHRHYDSHYILWSIEEVNVARGLIQFDGHMECWENDDQACWLKFDGTGRVIGKFVTDVQKVDHGQLGNLFWRVKRQWRHWFPE
jgi:hypothetical protein